ncbi:hypothetical protein V1291_002300 [Nitrobacteraceae bacterium AZCC 1564]
MSGASGGDAFIVPSYALLGVKLGWQAPDKSWSVFIEGRNLTDVAYAADFAPSPTVPVTQNPGPPPFSFTPARRRSPAREARRRKGVLSNVSVRNAGHIVDNTDQDFRRLIQAGCD